MFLQFPKYASISQLKIAFYDPNTNRRMLCRLENTFFQITGFPNKALLIWGTYAQPTTRIHCFLPKSLRS